MRIGIDARAYGWAGIGRYTRNLLRGLAQATDRHRFVVATGQKNAAAAAADLPRDRFTIAVVDDSYYSWREQTRLPRQLQKISVDLWHFTHFNVPWLLRRPYVVTIHDITRFIFPGQTQQRLMSQVAYEFIFKQAVARARAVICVSASTRTELGRLPLTTPPLTRVIPEAVEDMFRQPVSGEARARARMLLGIQGPYVLYVGVWMGHKNLPRLLAAFARVLKSQPDLVLVLTGRPRPGYVPVDRLATQLGLRQDQVLYLGFVPDHLLPGLYAEASCLALPSLYEGFGLPALEAAAVGTPVVASNISSLPDVLGGAAVWVNPEFVSSIAAGITKALLRSEVSVLVSRAQQRAGVISWEEVAKQTLAVYEAVK